MFGLDRPVFLGIARDVRSRGDLRMGAMLDVVQQEAASKDAAPVRGMPVPWQPGPLGFRSSIVSRKRAFPFLRVYQLARRALRIVRAQERMSAPCASTGRAGVTDMSLRFVMRPI